MTGRVAVGDQQEPDGCILAPEAFRHRQVVEALEGPGYGHRDGTGDAEDVAQLVLTQCGHSQDGRSTQPDQAQHQHEKFEVVRELHEYAFPRLDADAPQAPCHPVDRRRQLGIAQPAFGRYGRTPVRLDGGMTEHEVIEHFR
jgi:hypothetical protein